MDNNDYSAPGSGKIGYYNSTSYSTLSTWQTATGKDGASWNVVPSFTSSTDLHIPNGTSTPLESGGAPVSVTGVAFDIDNTPRPGAATNGYGTAPDIGADEFDGINPAPNVNAVTITPAGGQCTAVAHTITASVKPGTSTLTSVKLNYTINGGTNIAVTMTGGSLSTLSTWTGTIPIASPINGIVAWNVTASDGTYNKVVVGTTYQDAPLTGYTVATSTSKSAFCLGDSTVLNAVAGPTSIANSYDYAAIPFDTAANPTSGVTTLASGGTASTSLTSGSLDDGYWTVSLPFSFKFYGSTFTSAGIGTNGSFMFGSSTTGGYSSTWPSTSAPLGAFGVLFGDLNVNAGTVEYFVTGTAPNRVFVVNWKGINWYSSTPSATFQAKIFESTNVLESHILSCTSGNSHKLGLNDLTGATAVQPPTRTYGSWAVTTPEAWRFSPQILPNATFLWTPNGPGSGIATGDETKLNIKVKPTTTTRYKLTVSNATTCGIVDSVLVTVNQPPAIVVSPTPAKVCLGSSLALTASGGTTYNWSPTATLSAGTGTTVTATPTVATTYTITSTSSAGCAGSTTKQVVVNPLPTVIITPSTTTTFCAGGNVALTASGATSYSWIPTSGLSSSAGATVTASPISTTTYIVTGTDVNGCTDTGMQLVSVNPLPT
ncbi:MAG: hypothetical protein ABI169_03565, partial [Chitinophagaceae bacterium]